jgi:hypothetical protein
MKPTTNLVSIARRSATVLIVMLVVALIPVTASAKKRPPEPPEAGTTCEFAPFDTERLEAIGDIDITLSSETFGKACIDWWPDPDGELEVTVTVNEGVLRKLVLIPRDSIPGDSCGDGLFFNKEKDIPTDPIPLPDIPPPTVNACGTELAEWVDGTIYYEADSLVDSPLALAVGIGGSRDLEVRLEVKPAP